MPCSLKLFLEVEAPRGYDRQDWFVLMGACDLTWTLLKVL